MENELQHHGVKGMKWGVRKKRDPADTAARANRFVSAGRAVGEAAKGNFTGAAYYARKASMFNKGVTKSDAKAGKAKNERADDKTTRETKKAKLTPKEKVAKGAKAVAGTLAKVGQAYVADQLFFGGMGTTACKEAIRVIGMAGITAYTMARGGYDIKWYDKQGNRVV